MKLENFSNYIQENDLCHDSYKVAINVADYITKKIEDKFDCAKCLTLLSFNQDSTEYFEILSRGCLMKPSIALANYVCNGFITLDTVKKLLLMNSHNIKSVSLLGLEAYQATDDGFMGMRKGEGNW